MYCTIYHWNPLFSQVLHISNVDVKSYKTWKLYIQGVPKKKHLVPLLVVLKVVFFGTPCSFFRYSKFSPYNSAYFQIFCPGYKSFQDINSAKCFRHISQMLGQSGLYAEHPTIDARVPCFYYSVCQAQPIPLAELIREVRWKKCLVHTFTTKQELKLSQQLH